MQHHPYQPPLVIKPVFSWQLTIFIWGLHSVILLFTLFLFPSDWIYRILLATVVIVSWYYYHQLHINKQLTRSIHQVIIDDDDQWQIFTADKTESEKAKLLRNSFLHRTLIILNFKSSSGKQYALILPPDSLPKELARKLRARIKIMKK